jgi:transcriptional regulator with XRE-family HTH domain
MATQEQIKTTIKRGRLRRGDSQEAAAEIVGVQRLQWIRWEKGTNVPSTVMRRALAAYLEVPEHALMLDPDTAADDPLTRQIRAIVRDEIERIRIAEMAGAA